jgi:DNA-binding MarR family transcriptional regulator
MTDQPESGRFAYEGLARVIHEKARLGILTSLATNARGLFFTDLKELCSLTDGNLSRHLKALGDAGLIEQIRGTDGRRPATLVRLTETGRRRFAEYVSELERVVADALEAGEEADAPFPDGWEPA